MNSLKKIVFIIALFLQTAAFAQSANKTIFEVKLNFHTMVGNLPLMLDSNYTTPLGDTFSVTKFKYYINHISFFNADGKEEKIANSYYLIDESNSFSKTITVQMATKEFTRFSFLIGVDSIKNVSGVQTGALDPANGMFWTWNSGYIMAKLEGKSPQSKAPFGNITYHVGGFKEKDNVVRMISLNVRRETSVVRGSLIGDSSHDSRFTSHDSNASRFTPTETTIDINVDLNKWFDGPHPIKIAEKPFCMSPGKMAIDIADNYANMFSIKSISIK